MTKNCEIVTKLSFLIAIFILSVLKKTRQMYDGTRRSPWNEIECGDHYSRPMSAFSLFALASGQVKI